MSERHAVAIRRSILVIRKGRSIPRQPHPTPRYPSTKGAKHRSRHLKNKAVRRTRLRSIQHVRIQKGLAPHRIHGRGGVGIVADFGKVEAVPDPDTAQEQFASAARSLAATKTTSPLTAHRDSVGDCRPATSGRRSAEADVHSFLGSLSATAVSIGAHQIELPA